jgi:hypothetical protein
MSGLKKFLLLLSVILAPLSALGQGPGESFEEMIRRVEWPNTDFSKTLVDLDEVHHGGPAKDGIPAIDDPKFVPVRLIKDIAGTEPVITVEINGEARAYPFRVLMFHEIVNDKIKGVPITITFCPLCNTAIVFSREVGGRVLNFGVTGWLRNSDLVMYDRQTESWWQQFTGRAIIGEMAGQTLTKIPARIESFANFKERYPRGDVLVPNRPGHGDYGVNLYQGYDALPGPFYQLKDFPENIKPMARVVTVGNRAWALTLVRKAGKIVSEDGLVITWEEGQNSALDSHRIDQGRDVGNVLVQQKTETGLKDVVYGVDFAFAFYAFYPDSPIIVE